MPIFADFLIRSRKTGRPADLLAGATRRESSYGHHSRPPLAVCEDGLFFVDATPQENRMWRADPRTDNVLFFFMA